MILVNLRGVRGKAEGMVIRDTIELLDCITMGTVSYTHLRAHETVLDLVCRLLLEKKNHFKCILNLGHYQE